MFEPYLIRRAKENRRGRKMGGELKMIVAERVRRKREK